MPTYEENWKKLDQRIRDTYVFIRDSDKKEFRSTFSGHVSVITAEDGEEDTIKWAWNDSDGNLTFVSMNKGHMYTRIPRNNNSLKENENETHCK